MGMIRLWGVCFLDCGNGDCGDAWLKCIKLYNLYICSLL